MRHLIPPLVLLLASCSPTAVQPHATQPTPQPVAQPATFAGTSSAGPRFLHLSNGETINLDKIVEVNGDSKSCFIRFEGSPFAGNYSGEDARKIMEAIGRK